MELTQAEEIQARNSGEFIDLVLRRRPRLAAFDCDGTLWSIDSGEDFMRWSMKRGIVSAEVAEQMDRRYADYKNGKVGEETMCGEMVTMYAGISVSSMEAAARDYFRERVPVHIYSEMADLVRRLLELECDLWLVSSTNEWVIGEGARHLNLNPLQVLAASAEIEDGIVSNRIRRVPSGVGKARALREIALPSLDAAFGNSIHDLEMLRMAQFPIAVNPTAQLEPIASEAGWQMYFANTSAAKAALWGGSVRHD